jgi:hypothetical protein
MVIQAARRTIRGVFLSTFVLGILLWASPSFALCLAGLPCTTPATSNDPYDGTISPNESGPNKEKTDRDMCDADFMNQIYAKAFLEAERENILNGLVIRKPDSVLEYSCYEQHVNITAHKAGPLFTETDYWWNREVKIDNGIGDNDPDWWDIDTVPVFVSMCPPDDPQYPTRWDDPTRPPGAKKPCTKLDNSLEDLVLYALHQYVSKNFNHDFLGGYAAGFNNDITGTVGSPDYLCDVMYTVNLAARCDDFDTDDKFFDFETLVSLDPRILPEMCTGGTAITQDIIDVYKNDGAQYAAWDYTEIELYLERILNIGGPSVTECAAPVPTGIQIRRENRTYNLLGGSSTTVEYDDEYICTNPGCSYDYDQSKCLPP